MSAVPPDDDLRRQLKELGRHEASTAPRFERVLQGRPRPASSRARVWVMATVGMALIAAVAWWWPTADRPAGRDAEMWAATRALEWDLPTDGLLAQPGLEKEGREVDRLSREIEGLLRP